METRQIAIGGAVVVVLAFLAYLMLGGLVALLVIVVGGLGIAALYQRSKDAEGGGSVKEKTGRGKKAPKGKAKLDQILSEQGGDTATKKKPSSPAGGGLPTWNPTGLDTWKPPSLSGSDDVEAEEAEPSQWDSWDNDWEEGSESGTATATLDDEERDVFEEDHELPRVGALDDNPLDALDRLDDIDPIAEVERIEGIGADEDYDPLGSLDTAEELDITEFEEEFEEYEEAADEPAEEAPAKSGGFSFSSAPPVVNESVASDDDIMAASAATEVHIEDAGAGDGDSELAKLLAKVQARLSAYE